MKKIAVLLILGVIAIFPVRAHVDLSNPEGGEVYYAGNNVSVTWVEVQAHNTLNWDLYFSRDGGESWETVKADIPVKELSYQWTVPAVVTAQAKIKIVQDNEGTDYEGISANFTILLATGFGKSLNLIQMDLYPNPLLDFTRIKFNNPLQRNHTLSIYNTQGRLVRSIPDITSERVKIERENLSSGLYIIRLRDEKEIRAVSKLVVE